MCRFLAIAGVSLWFFASLPASADEIKWLTDYRSARLEAASKDRLLVIHFTTTNCYWCKRLEAETLSNGIVAGQLNKKCVALKVDGRRDASLIEALRIKSYPTVVFASPDGRIVELHEGYEDASRFQLRLGRCLAAVETLDRLAKDYQDSLRALKDGENAKAIALLKEIMADGKDRPVQIKAKQTLLEIENQASEQLSQVRSRTDKEDTTALALAARNVEKQYPGTNAANEAGQFVNSLGGRPAPATNPRAQLARDHLALAQEDWRAGQYLACLERCEQIVRDYADLNEADDALHLASAIKSDPERLKMICEKLGDKLATLYLDQAEAVAAKGNIDQAIQCLERVARMFPGSQQSARAQERLLQLQNRVSVQREAQKIR
jgi:thioredoxin-related protein